MTKKIIPLKLENYISVQELAKRDGYSSRQILRLIKAKKLKAIKINCRWWIDYKKWLTQKAVLKLLKRN
jgi:hypothetical protein